jgi:hypothetical protein
VLAQQVDDLVLAAAQLQVEVQLDLLERGRREGLERLRQGQRGAAGGVAPVVGDDQRAALGGRQARIAVRGPEDVELDRRDAGLDRRREALECVAGPDPVRALMADQPQRLA